MCCGLDLPIINPNVESLMNAVYSYKVLAGEDENCRDYIMRFSSHSESKEIHQAVKQDGNIEMTIEEAVLKGLKVQTREIATRLLETMSETELINNKLIPALDIVGDKYEKQRTAPRKGCWKWPRAALFFWTKWANWPCPPR